MLLKTSKNKLNPDFSPIKLVILFGLLAPFILSSTITNFDGNTTKREEANPTFHTKINFQEQPNCVHIIVESLTPGTNQILSYGTEKTCKENRQLLSMNPDQTANVELFLTKSQIQNNKENYLCIECANATSCNFNINMTSEDSCKLELGNQYTYYVYSEHNAEMTFNITNNNTQNKSDSNIVTIWARGRLNKVSSSLVNINETSNENIKETSNENIKENKTLNEKESELGSIYSFKESDILESNYELKVTAHVGNLVTIGSSITKNSLNQKKIYPNSLEVMGYLKKGVKEEECYVLSGREEVIYEENADILFINGIVFEKFANTKFMVGNDVQYETPVTDGNIKDAIYAIHFNEKEVEIKLCVTFNSDKEKYSVSELVYTLQLVDNKRLPGVPVHYPQMLGTIYTRYSLAGHLTTYSSMRPLPEYTINEFNYNMKAVVGFPDMLYDVCTKYPKCVYDPNNLTSIKNPRHSNSFTTYSTYFNEKNYTFTPISAEQPLIIVNCTDGSQIKTDNAESNTSIAKSDFCSFETSIYSDTDYVTLKETAHYSQFLLSGEKDNYRILFKGETKITKIYLDLFLYTGDVNFIDFFIFTNGNQNPVTSFNKYNLASKIFYSITLPDSEDKEIYFTINATKNSFYTISYQLVRSDEHFSIGTNIIESGASFIQSIDLTWDKKVKYIELQNLRTLQGCPFLTNFYSLNCDFVVNRLTIGNDGTTMNKTVLITDNYGQDILSNNEIGYYQEYYKYSIEAVNNDASEYNKKLCMIYVSGVEIEETSTGMEREISVPENVPQQIVFQNGINKIKYAYHLSDLNDTIIISFDLIDKAPYELKVYFGYHQSEKNNTFARNKQFFVSPHEYGSHCEEKEVCTIIFEIILNRAGMNDSKFEPKLETTIRQTKSGPAYLPKNELKRDVLNGKYPRYFYTDIGPKEAGQITVNYHRGSGKIYGKLVKRNAEKEEENANWRGFYKFPESINDSLYYDTYLKKLTIEPSNTEKCEDGCYLLLTVVSSTQTSKNDSLVGQPFTIMNKIYNYSSPGDTYPKVDIEINEYVIGNIVTSTDNLIYEFYELWIPYDADTVIFDWQSDGASLYVNVGDERPTKDNAHFNFTSVGHDTIFSLTKEEILKKCVESKINVPKEGSLKDLNLVIGVWTDKTDSIYTTIYALKVHLAKKNQIDIYHVRSDQKVLCKPEPQSDGTFRCLYAVILDGLDTVSSLTVFPRSQYASSRVTAYAKFVDQEYFEKNDVAYLEKNIPTETNCNYTSDTTKTPYIYVPRAVYSKAIFISVHTDNVQILELLSSTGSLTTEVTPNPSTVQLFNTKSKLTLDFMSNQDYLINVVTLNGDGDVYWEDEPQLLFYLHGIDDRLSLTSGKNKKEGESTEVKKSESKLVFETKETSTNESDPGFLFYLTYYPRTTTYNCDQLKVGKSTEFNYRSADFPINFIVPLKDLKTEIHASLNFYGFEDDKNRTRWFNTKDMLLIWGTIISEEEAYKARLSNDYKPQKSILSVEGTFDGGINVAYLSINKTILEQYKNTQIKEPYLFFSVVKNEEIKFNFSKISAEATILQESGAVPVTEKVYQYGRVGYDADMQTNFTVFVLKINKNKPYMRIEFSANSDHVNWSISIHESLKENSPFEEFTSEYYNGKTVVTFKVPDDKEELYLNIFPTNDTDLRLCNYVFKYMNALTKDKFNTYKVNNSTIELKTKTNGEGNADYTVKVEAIPNSENIKTSYILKGIYKTSYYNGESMSTIAMTNSKGFTSQQDCPEVNKNDNTVTLNVSAVSSEIEYLQVIAKIKDRSINEFVAYTPIKIDEEEKVVPIESTDKLIELNFTRSKDIYYVKGAKKKQKYLIGFNGNEPNYINVRVTSDKSPSQVIYFSYDDQDGIKNREQLAQNGANKNVNMWLKKEQFTGGGRKLYIIVECQNTKDSCDYKLTFTGHDAVEEGMNFVYNYYVSEKNKQMIFKITNSYHTNETVFTLYGRGSDNISLKLKNHDIKPYKFKLGKAMTFKLPSNENELELTVEAKTGDYISVGASVTYGNVSISNLLKPNQREISGYLKKDVLDNICYTVDFQSDDFKEANRYITGEFYDRIGEIYVKGTENSTTLVDKGTAFYKFEKPSNDKTLDICVRFPGKEHSRFNIFNIPFSIQVIVPNEMTKRINIYSPQGNGIIYPRIIPKNTIVYFSGSKSNDGTKDVTYNMLRMAGLPKMLINKCTTFPVCNYDEESNKNINFIKPYDINRMSSWKTNDKIDSPISNEQNLLIVNCTESKYDFCYIETSIFGNNDEINLIENGQISQYVTKGEVDNFVIDFRNETGLKKVYLDTVVLSGEVSFELNDKDSKIIDPHKYYLANKIFFSISLENNPGLDRVFLKVTAKKNSYYELETRLIRSDSEQSSNVIYSGISYLVSIDTNTKSKNIKINTFDFGESSTYFTNFMSLNCKVKISRTDQTNPSIQRKNIPLYDNYAQDVYKNYNDIYSNYQVNITEADTSNYQNKMCMLYVSSIEETTSNSYIQREIVISENVPQTVIFNNDFKKIRYLYPDADVEKDILFDFRMIDMAKYKTNFYYNSEEPVTEYKNRSEVIIIGNADLKLKCQKNSLCPIVIEIELDSFVLENNSPMLEFTIRQPENVPAYLPKNIAKKDFVVNQNYLYLYTDIGEREQGYVTVDFSRGSGKVYGKIVQKNQTKVDDNANWRNYKFPKTVQESIKYDVYEKSLSFVPEETEICQNGCYLLITIQSSIRGNQDINLRFHPITVITSFTPDYRTYNDIPKIVLQADEYVIGNIGLDTSERLYHFYQIWLPNDAEKVEFDWQSDVANLYVNVGDERPTKTNADFKLGSKWSDTIFEISKNDILTKAERKKYEVPFKNSLKYVSLVIGIGTNVIDSIYTTVYSLKVHLPLKNDLNIYKVDADQKTLCKPQKEGNNYRCLFMILTNDLYSLCNLMVYAESQDKSANTYMYAHYIEKEIYDTYENDKLKSNIPNENSKYNNKKENVNYIFITSPENKKYLFVNVVTDKPSILEFLSSFYTYDQKITPNPSTSQLFSVSQESLTFVFPTTKDLLINLVSLSGEAEINWDVNSNDVYHLRGRDDRLSLTSPHSTNGVKLIIKNKTPQTNSTESNSTMETPGFSFYVSYYLRAPNMNFDEISFGKTVEMAYSKADFPIHLYSKIDNIDHEINVAVSFKNMELEKNEATRIIKTEDFNLKGGIIKEETVYSIKINPELVPSTNVTKNGVFDPAIKTAQVFLSKKDLEKFKITNEQKPTLYFEMAKAANHESVKYTKFNAEVSIIKENADVPATEKLYQYGKIGGDKFNVYKLKIDNNTDFMRIQFSANSDNVKFTINTEKEKKENSTFDWINTTTSNGIVYITFKKPKDKDYLYLNVYANDPKISEKLNNYVFKYINAKSVDKFILYNIYNNDTNLTKTFEKEKLSVKFNKIDKEKVKVTYSLRWVSANSYINHESMKTIAVTESPSTVVQKINPTINNNTITIDLDGVHENNTSVIQVIAQITDGVITEYVCYNEIYNPNATKEEKKDEGKKEEDKKEGENGNGNNKGKGISMWVVVGLGSALFVVLIILFVVIFVCRSRNKDLMNKVNKISFVKSKAGEREGDINLLLNDNQNELE